MKVEKIQINLPEFYEAQKEVVKECIYGKAKYIVLNGSRQIGKTFILTNISLAWALQNPNQLVMVISPTDTQAKKIYKQTLDTLEPCYKEVVKSTRGSGGNTDIIMTNGSQILYRSAESENTLRGYSLNYICIDEAAFVKEEVWRTILAPSLSVKGKKVFFCSTPKGSNFFKQLFYKGIDGDDGYKSYKIIFTHNPYANLEFIKEQEELLPLEIYEQEYLGTFTDSTGVFKNVDELAIHNVQEPKGQKCTIGIDIAFVNDYTVAVCLDSNGIMLDYIRFNKTETPELVDKLSQFVKKWKPMRTIMETNNQGLPVFELLRRAGVTNLEGFNTNSSSKQEIINKLMAAFSKKEIGLLRDDVVIEEMKAFTYALSKTGKITFAASHGHDDICMSLALAWHVKSNHKPTVVVARRR